jgi:hypothetical protein
MSVREMTVSIDNVRHYRHPVTGELAPSVTAVLDALDKAALLHWAVETTAQYALDNLEVLSKLDRRTALDMLKGSRYRKSGDAADKGTDAHAVLEDLARGATVLNNNHNSWVLNCWEQLTAEFDIEVLEVEPTFWNGEQGYAGSADLVARVDGELAVLDYKTSGSGVYGETSLQLCAYSMAPQIIRPTGEVIDFRETYGEVQRTYTVWLRPEDNGKYVGKAGWSLLPMRYDETVWRAFRAARIAWQWLNVDSKAAVGRPLNSTHIGSKRRKARRAA